MILNCTCHGFASACALKTCWEELPPFKTIAQKLRDKFDNAVLVRPIAYKTKLRVVYRGRGPSSADLVYSRNSPNFCGANPKLGIPGTRGRTCSVYSLRADGCELMCCGRGYRTTRRFIHAKCSAVKKAKCRKAQLEHHCL